jgi:hypothetical protein
MMKASFLEAATRGHEVLFSAQLRNIFNRKIM